MPTFALNFSRPGNQIVAQYYNFLRMGFEGYQRVQQTSQDVALYLSDKIDKLGPFECLTRGDDIPVFIFKVKNERDSNFSVFDISEMLRHRGWLIPAYTLPENCTDMAVLRIVVKEGFSRDMADLLLEDMGRILEHYKSQPGYKPRAKKGEGSVRC